MLDRTGVVRVVILNKHLIDAAEVDIRLPGKQGVGTLKRLEAPSLDATSGLTYAGQTFDQSADGNAVGALKDEAIRPADGGLRFRVAPASAALLTIAPAP
jgi:hypothetical protein